MYYINGTPVGGVVEPATDAHNVDIATLSGAICEYSKSGDVVFMLFDTVSSISSGTWVNVGELPEGARPSTGFYDCCINYASGAVAEYRILTNGKIQIWAFSSGQYVGSVSFII